MTQDAEITAAFWHNLRSDRTVMLGAEKGQPTSLRPMQTQLEDDEDHGPIWFFTSTDTALVQDLVADDLALFTFVSKWHDIFATVHGHMTRSQDRAMVDRLWNPGVAVWYKDGKDDPDLALLRFDPVRAEIWRDGSGLLAGLKVLLGGDPQAGSGVAKVSLE